MKIINKEDNDNCNITSHQVQYHICCICTPPWFPQVPLISSKHFDMLMLKMQL